jgi:hypothetical protein
MNHDGNMEPFLADQPPEDYDEDNDEVDDAQGDAPALKHRVLFYTLEQKGKIVAEAYSQPRHVRGTVRKYQVQPVQIRRWRAQLQQCWLSSKLSLSSMLHTPATTTCYLRFAAARRAIQHPAKKCYKRVRSSGGVHTYG